MAVIAVDARSSKPSEIKAAHSAHLIPFVKLLSDKYHVLICVVNLISVK